MAPKTQLLQFKATIHAPAAEVFRAFTRSGELRGWFCNAAQADPRPGGRIYLWWYGGYYASGEFVTLIPHKKIVFTWHGKEEPAATRVTVALSAKGDLTRVTVTHSDIGAGKAWTPIVSEYSSGWKSALENLGSTLETGPDLRIMRRPMLGISGSDLTAETAAELGAPVRAGFKVGGLVDGMSAQMSGLQNGDIITKVAGHKVTGFHTLSAALQPCQAGDVVPVVFYRGPEKKTAALTLSARPQPNVPPFAGKLAEVARCVYAEAEAELIKCFEGTTEEAANRHPAPGEWNAKEIIAHLIMSEQGVFNFVAEEVAGETSWTDGQGENVQAPLTALLSIYQTVPELMEKLRYTEAEVVALLAALPPECVARKSSYWRVGHLVSEMPLHYHEHVGQLRAALKAAKPG